MLKQEHIASIAKLLKLDATTLTAAIEAKEETDVAIPEGLTALTAAELASRDKTIKATGYTEGKSAGLEVFVKDKKEALGLDFEGKDPETFVTKLQEKVLADAKIAPNDKIAEKERTIAKLQENITTLTKDKEAIAAAKQQVELTNKVTRLIPSTQLAVEMEPEEVISSMSLRGYSFESDNGNLIVKKGGEIVSDPTSLKPLDAKEVVTGYLKERKWLAGEQQQQQQREGRAGGNSSGKGGTPTKYSEAEAAWKAEGKSANGVEFTRHIEGLAAANKEFDYNS
jgi:hypothetical protein